MMKKNYIEIGKDLDLKIVRAETENIKILQTDKAYPEFFSYPITLQFEVTGVCNLNCKHCYNRSGDKDVVSNSRMTPNKWKELSKQIVKDGGIFQCILSGGEPLLLGDHLFDIMDILHEDGTSFVVITNALLLTKEKVKRFSKYRFYWFQISIDGSNAMLHDEFRGVNGSWEKAVAGALEISNAGIPLVIAHTVTPKTLDKIEDMVELSYNLGAGSIIIGEVLPSGRAISNNEIMLTQKEKEYLYKTIAELNKKYRGKIRIDRSMNVSVSMERYVSQPNLGGIIRPNGDFRLDCMAPFTIGNVCEQSIKDIWLTKGISAWQNPKLLDFIKSIDDNEQKGNIQNHVWKDVRI